MKKNAIYVFIGAFISIVIPLPARFAYGIVILFALNFLLLMTILIKYAVAYLNLSSMQPAVYLTILVALVIFIKQILILYSPVLAMTCSFSLYLIAFSSFLIGFILNDEGKSLGRELLYDMKYSGIFTLLMLPVFLIRDILGYGTITLPSPSGIIEYNLPSWAQFQPSIFWASIPGAFIILAILVAVASWINRKFIIIEGKETDAN